MEKGIQIIFSKYNLEKMMKNIQKLSTLGFMLALLMMVTKSTSANWYSGVERPDAYGVRAYISTPNGLSLREIGQSGESN